MPIRLFSSGLDPRLRRLYRALLAFYFVLTLALVWPLATVFAKVRPLMLGMPFSLFAIALLILTSFSVLLALFIWEGRTGHSCDPPDEIDRAAAGEEKP